ncbi:MAG: 3-phosphoglycerate dehydrogenase [Candidatus Thermoplasmatota archaeon]|jgi:D-3-phosphoglycerate dehydrogenase|nr:3-phosphoglycerate dehydrogenase [Candidatus Thermoplasmatota archaeon]MCL5667945.1 3-phosphoglycerate dehydrogenase [Candidatus Thermoplasmatota archaeon]
METHIATRGRSVLITDVVDKTLVEELNRSGFQTTYKPEIKKKDLEKEIGQYDVLVVRSRTKVDHGLIEMGKNLKVIARAGIGLDSIDVDAAKERKIKVVYAPGSSTQSVVELTVMLAIMLLRNVKQGIKLVERGEFIKSTGQELKGKTLGIIGFGRIGYQTAVVMKTIGMNVVAFDTFQNHKAIGEVGGRFVALDELMAISDVISVNVTMGRDDGPILSKKQFNGIRNGAIIINTSRAAAIDGADLLDALMSGKVRGFATDVLWNEPPQEKWERDIIEMKNVIVTPHIGAQTLESQKRVASITAENIIGAFTEVN